MMRAISQSVFSTSYNQPIVEKGGELCYGPPVVGGQSYWVQVARAGLPIDLTIDFRMVDEATSRPEEVAKTSDETAHHHQKSTEHLVDDYAELEDRLHHRCGRRAKKPRVINQQMACSAKRKAGKTLVPDAYNRMRAETYDEDYEELDAWEREYAHFKCSYCEQWVHEPDDYVIHQGFFCGKRECRLMYRWAEELEYEYMFGRSW